MTEIFRAERLHFIAAQCRSDFLGVLACVCGVQDKKGVGRSPLWSQSGAVGRTDGKSSEEGKKVRATREVGKESQGHKVTGHC